MDCLSFQPRRKAKGTQVYLISATGGEAFPVTHEEDGIDAFAWSPDSQTLYFAAKSPLSSAEVETHKKQWHDVIQFREDERGDVIQRQQIPAAIAGAARAQDDKPSVAGAWRCCRIKRGGLGHGCFARWHTAGLHHRIPVGANRASLGQRALPRPHTRRNTARSNPQ